MYEPSLLRWTALAACMILLVPTACRNQYRREDRSTESSDQTVVDEDSAVDPKADPRFPGGGAARDRTGFWVDEPVETGSVSPTAFANAVVDRMPAVDKHCCGPDRKRCRGFDGRMLLSLQLDGSGRVRDASLAETSIYDRSFQRCLLERATSWQMPAPGSGDAEQVLIPIYLRVEQSDTD